MAGQLTLMLGAVACATVLATVTSLAEAANEDDCRKFHQECSEARAQGYSRRWGTVHRPMTGRSLSE